jgi:hypothetical protein
MEHCARVKNPQVSKVRRGSGPFKASGARDNGLANSRFHKSEFHWEKCASFAQREAPRSWAHNHSPQSYGKQSYKKGKFLLSSGQLNFSSKHPGR